MNSPRLLTVTIHHPKKQELEFFSAEEFDSWLTKESEFWNSFHGNLAGVSWSDAAEQVERVRRMRQHFDAWKGNHEDTGALASVEQNAGGYLFLGQSPEGQLVADARQTNGDQAAIMLGCLCNCVRNDWPQRYGNTFYRAIFLAECFKSGIGGDADTARLKANQVAFETLSLQTKELEALNQAVRKQIEDGKVALASAVTSGKAALDKVTGDGANSLKSAVDDSKNTADASLKAIRDDFLQLKAVYEEEMKLKAPAAYWTDRGRGHRRAAWIFGALFVIYLVALAIILHRLAVGFFGTWDSVTKLLADQAAQKVPPAGAGMSYVDLFPRVGFIVLLASIGIWIGRILARIFLGNLHLSVECGERATMTSAYLALIKEKSLDKQERLLALGAVFRPSTSGMITDDAAPPTVIDILKKSGP